MAKYLLEQKDTITHDPNIEKHEETHFEWMHLVGLKHIGKKTGLTPFYKRFSALIFLRLDTFRSSFAIAKLSPNFSFSWAEVAIFPANPPTPPPSGQVLFKPYMV